MTTERQDVLVGVDGSPESVAALSWAADYGKATGARVRAVMAWHYPAAVGPSAPGRAPASVTAEVEAEMSEKLATAINAAAPDAGIVPVIANGHPAELLVNASADAGLLVVGSRGHGAFTGMLTGSVSLHCVNHAHCPVVVVRPRQ
jgi:nucleotide-binding universal stress UspA family protein